MAAVLNAGPALEPVTLAQAKAYLRVDSADEDDLILSLITAARISAELQINRLLIEQSWSVFMDCWPGHGHLKVPLGPLIRVDAVQVYGADDVAAPVDPAHFFVDQASHPARISLRMGRTWPQPGRTLNGIELMIACGYGASADAVPEPLRQAVLQLVAHWFENREPVVLGQSPMHIPQMVSALLAPYRVVNI